MPDFSRGHVLIVGDVMLDRYWHGSTSRISPGRRFPSLRVGDRRVPRRRRGNVIAQRRDAGLLGAPGRPGRRRRQRRCCTEAIRAGGVRCNFVTVPGSQTILLRASSRATSNCPARRRGRRSRRAGVRHPARGGRAWRRGRAGAVRLCQGRACRCCRAGPEPRCIAGRHVDPGARTERYRGATIDRRICRVWAVVDPLRRRADAALARRRAMRWG